VTDERAEYDREGPHSETDTPLRCRLFGHKMPLSGDVRQAGEVRVEEATCKRCGEVFTRVI